MLRRDRIGLLVLSLGLALLATLGAIASYAELRKQPSAPSRVSVSDAAALIPVDSEEEHYVELTDGVLDCESLYYRERTSTDSTDYWTNIIVTDLDRTIVVFAEYDGRLGCTEVRQKQAAGLLSRASESDFEPFLELAQVDQGAYKNARSLMSLDATWSPRYARGLMVILVIVALGCLSLYPLVRLVGK